MSNGFIALPPGTIVSVDFYLSPRLLERAAPDKDIASFLISVGVQAVIEAYSDQILPGISSAYRFHREERQGQTIFTSLTCCKGAAPVEHLEHLGKLLKEITEHAVPQAIEVMQMVRRTGANHPGNRAARRKASSR